MKTIHVENIRNGWGTSKLCRDGDTRGAINTKDLLSHFLKANAKGQLNFPPASEYDKLRLTWPHEESLLHYILY